MLCVGGREGNLFGGEADIPLRQEQLTPRESRDLARLARQMTSNPENAKRELDKSRTSSHVGHTNPITIQVLENGNEVLSWKGDAIGIEGGLLRKIATLMRVG